MKAILLALLIATAALAQAAHSVTVTWVDGVNPTGTTYNLYRATGACPAVSPTTVTPAPPPTWTLLGNTATLAITDSTVAAGTTYCYLVSATAAGSAESLGNPVSVTTVPTVSASSPVTQLKTTPR